MSHNFVNFQPFLLIFEILYASWSILSATKWTHEDVRKTILYSIRHEICSIERVLLWWRRCFFVLYATSKQIPWAWNIELFHPKHPCLGTRKNPSCVPYFCHSSQAKHPYFGPQHPSKSRSVTDGVCELVHFQQRGLRGKKIPSRWNFKFFMYVLQKNSILRSI